MIPYRQWFRKSLTIDWRISLGPSAARDHETITEFLSALGYRDITVEDETIQALRGNDPRDLAHPDWRLWKAPREGDPRRHLHTTYLTLRSDAIDIRTIIESRYSVGTLYDSRVYIAEYEMLRQHLEFGTFDDSEMQEAQKLRIRSDWVTLILVSGFTAIAVFGTVLFLMATLHEFVD